MARMLRNTMNRVNESVTRAVDVCRVSVDNVLTQFAERPSVTAVLAKFRGLAATSHRGDPPTSPSADPLASSLEKLTHRLCARLPTTLPTTSSSARFVNGRGQMLSAPGRPVIDISDLILTLLYAPSKPRAVDETVDTFRTAPLVWRAHQCVNDQGQGYIQQQDADEAAIKTYVLAPFLSTYVALSPRMGFDEATFSSLCARTLAALRADAVEKKFVTPVLGVTLGGQYLVLGENVLLRGANYDERERWGSDESIELSIARDLLVAECVVEVTYRSAWAPDLRDQILVQSFWDSDGFEDAHRKTDQAIAALRLATGRELPLVFSEIQTVSLPWVRNRFYRRPTLRDVQRRMENSPLFNRVVDAVELSSHEHALVCSLARLIDLVYLDPKVQTALWVFNDERNYINLYKCYELILSDVGGRIVDWVEKSGIKRFSHTANSPAAIGYSLARHGRENRSPPEAPMTLADADALIRRLIVAWITDKASAPSEGT